MSKPVYLNYKPSYGQTYIQAQAQIEPHAKAFRNKWGGVSCYEVVGLASY